MKQSSFRMGMKMLLYTIISTKKRIIFLQNVSNISSVECDWREHALTENVPELAIDAAPFQRKRACRISD